MTDEEISVSLYNYVRTYVPIGWKEPIGKVMFVPLFSRQDVALFKEGKIKEYNFSVINMAIEDFLRK